ncbi:hypothetical protein OROHE_014919 [Orobanche hederae]
MATHTPHPFLHLLPFLGLLLLSAADDSALMSSLLSSLSLAPPRWSASTPSATGQMSTATPPPLTSPPSTSTLPPSLVLCPLSSTSFSSSNPLQFKKNSLSGTLPSFENMTSLEQIYLTKTTSHLFLTISFKIPSYLAESTNLVTFYASNASITGIVPDIFGNKLRVNRFTGVVPPSLMILPNLVNITLQNYKLQGPFPEFPRGAKLDIGNTNSFCLNRPGPCDPQVSTLLDVAADLGYPVSLAESWQGNNVCADWRFISCDSQGRNITVVNMDREGFSGTISPAFANMSYLRNLVLNNNNLTGAIPSALTSLPQLQIVDLSSNNLFGPLLVFPSSVRFIYGGNLLLGRNETSGGAGGSIRPKGLPSGSSSVLQWKELVKPSGANGYGGVPSELQSQSSGDHSEIPNFEGGNVTISIQVLRQVTNNFSEENVLGRGGFGVVYKGELHDGTKIAMKRMESGVMGTKGLNEFQAEIDVLTKVWHRHLVALLGYYINESDNSFRGVEYLHGLTQQSFIHRDLKPTNILLTDDMRAKVADFGLVKNAPGATGRVTTEVDVYSFGVVLVEIVTGRKALDETPTGERSHLVTWIRRILINKDNLRKSVDQILDPDDDTYESICKVSELAGHCTAREPFQRPDMGHAVNVLGPLVGQWKPSGPEEEDAYNIDLQMSLPQALQRWQADEGTSRMFDDFSYSQTQSSIPSKPFGFVNSFSSRDCR